MRLKEVAKELAALAEAIGSPRKEAEFPPEAVLRMQAGKCLNCDRKKDEITMIRRGLCQACYQRLQRELPKNPLLEDELIGRGLLAPSGFTAKTAADPSPLDEAIRAAWSKAKAEADADNAAALEMVKKKRATRKTKK